MPERAAHRDPHTAVKQELLVRYLDAWTPTVLRSQRRASYLESSRDGSAAAALRVFGEFADRLTGHQLDVVVLGASDEPLGDVLDELGRPAGLSVRTVEDPDMVRPDGAVLAHLDLVGDGALDEPAAWRLVDRLAKGRAGEVLLTLPPADPAWIAGYRDRLGRAGLGHVAEVELADGTGRVQLLVFAAGVEKHLTVFKDALWAADAYAGIRYRDPRDPEHTQIDISLTPPLAPLRRAVLEELARCGRCSVAELRRYTLRETIYRPAEVNRVLASLTIAGAVSRTPEKGRLTPGTVVRLHKPPRE
ncbi:MAG TPA: hypothetical protein VFZ32_09990 [Micromonosporaceae bacterium]